MSRLYFSVSGLLLAALMMIGSTPRVGTAAPSESLQSADRGKSTNLLTREQRAAAIDAIADQFSRFYVFPEKRAEIIKSLRDAESAGRYDVDSGTVFAEKVTEDLLRVSHDAHLNLNFSPDWYATATAPAQAEPSDEASYERMSATQSNHGLVEMKLMLGNVRYLRITGFYWIRDLTGAVYDDAMRFLHDGDAIILDLRGNGGGSHDATRYLVSHFLDEDVLLYTFFSQKAPTRDSRTLGYLPAGRILGKPAYVLIDGRTRSAGEDVAYQFQQYRLGQLVGAKTVGAANNNDLVPIAPAFRLSISVGRPLHPVSKTNWEGVGIAPDLACPPEQALDVAYTAALDQLNQTVQATPLMKAEYAWAREGAQARLSPRRDPASKPDRLAGKYGDIDVQLRAGELWLVRPGRQAARLLPMGGDKYFVEDTEPLRVRLTKSALTLYILGAPEPREYPRS